MFPFTGTQHRPSAFYSDAECGSDWTQEGLYDCKSLIMLSIREYTHWHKLSNIHQLNVWFYHKLISYQRTGKVWIANFRCNSVAKAAAEWVIIRIRFLISSCQITGISCISVVSIIGWAEWGGLKYTLPMQIGRET